MNPRNRTDWGITMEVLRRMRERAGSREAFLEIPKLYGQVPGYNYIRRFSAAVFAPMHLFTYPNKVFTENIISCIKYSWKQFDDRKVDVIWETTESCPGTNELWELQAIATSKVPGFLGLPDADVTIMQTGPHRAVFHCVLPPSGTVWDKLRRFFFRSGARPAEEPAATGEIPGPGLAEETVTEMAAASLAFHANEVSCRVTLGFAEMAEAGGIPREKILSGFRHTPGHLSNPRNRTDWGICLGVLRKLRGEAGSREAFCEIARNYGQTPSYAFMKSFISGIFSPKHFYTFPQHIFLQQVLGKFITWRWRVRDAKTIEGTLSTDAEHPGTLEFWDVCGVGMSKLPGFIKLPDAIVRVTSHDAHQATYRISLPPSGTMWARLGRFLRMHGTSPDPAFEILASEHEDLRRSYDLLNEIDRERADLSRQLLSIADGERESFAREIHDGLGQELFALKLQAEVLASQLDPALQGQAARLAEQAGKAQQLARSLARGYDPVVGAGGDFADAVRMLAARYDGKFAFDLDGLRSIPADGACATHLYRITQEAVTNAMRHGHAKWVRIAVKPAAGLWELRIEDDGTGYKAGDTGKAGLGVKTMSYRAAQIGGSLQIERRADGGTCVCCSFPAAEDLSTT